MPLLSRLRLQGKTSDGAEAEIDLESQLSLCEGGGLHFKVAACLSWNFVFELPLLHHWPGSRRYRP
jgi:hypothetical protein